MNWQREHEELMVKIWTLLGLPHGSSNAAIAAALSKATATVCTEYERLNKLNDEAVRKAEKQL